MNITLTTDQIAAIKKAVCHIDILRNTPEVDTCGIILRANIELRTKAAKSLATICQSIGIVDISDDAIACVKVLQLQRTIQEWQKFYGECFFDGRDTDLESRVARAAQKVNKVAAEIGLA